MSYLGPLRLHFAGQFQAAVSTVNNQPEHFDNEKFRAKYQEEPWNPRGDGNWRLIGCDVRSAFMADGSAASGSDPVLATTVADSDRRPPAKLVDLDPWQQMVSTVWGLEMRIADSSGETLVRGQFEPAAFFGLWQRVVAAPRPANPQFGAMYQSVLTDVSWGAIDDSPFLLALREASPGTLSVKFNVDGYESDANKPTFTLGRIVGTIGPSAAGEPHHMVRGRQLAPVWLGIKPKRKVNFCTAAVDEGAGKAYLDLGNALPTVSPGGEIENPGRLSLYAGPKMICAVPAVDAEEYRRTAGILALPPDRDLDAAELAELVAAPLSLRAEGVAEPVVTEIQDYARADAFVFRCDPGDAAAVRFYATRLGKPAAGVEIGLSPEIESMQVPEKEAGEGIGAGTPADAVSYPAVVKTGADGVAELRLRTKDPGSPRRYLDGQLYGIRPTLTGSPGEAVDPWNFVTLLLWSGFRPADPPTWHGDLQPIFQQYANLYPVMDGFLDLADYAEVWKNRSLLLLAFGLDVSDPNSMPVTRDLSRGRREAILAWLKDPEGPRLGTPPPAKAAPESVAAIEPEEMQGEKGAALARIRKPEEES